jgi:GcrA cell cycle regulator
MSMLDNLGWTDERETQLKKLWMDGLSASQCAAILGGGLSRNAVIGKVHRLKLALRGRPTGPRPRVAAEPRRQKPKGPKVNRGEAIGTRMKLARLRERAADGEAVGLGDAFDAEAYVAPQVEELYVPEDQRLSLLQLTEHTCKWPIGDPLKPDFYFCGQHSLDGKPYCTFHSARAYSGLKAGVMFNAKTPAANRTAGLGGR